MTRVDCWLWPVDQSWRVWLSYQMLTRGSADSLSRIRVSLTLWLRRCNDGGCCRFPARSSFPVRTGAWTDGVAGGFGAPAKCFADLQWRVVVWRRDRTTEKMVAMVVLSRWLRFRVEDEQRCCWSRCGVVAAQIMVVCVLVVQMQKRWWSWQREDGDGAVLLRWFSAWRWCVVVRRRRRWHDAANFHGAWTVVVAWRNYGEDGDVRRQLCRRLRWCVVVAGLRWCGGMKRCGDGCGGWKEKRKIRVRVSCVRWRRWWRGKIWVVNLVSGGLWHVACSGWLILKCGDCHMAWSGWVEFKW